MTPARIDGARSLAGTRAPEGSAAPERDPDRLAELEAAAVVVWPDIAWGLDDGRCSCSRAFRDGRMQVKVMSSLCVVHIPGRGPLGPPPAPARPAVAAVAELRPWTPRGARWPRAYRPACEAPALPPVSDADLLAVCEAGGARARALYARACEEWRQRHQAALLAPLQEQGEEIAAAVVRLVAEAAGVAGAACGGRS